MTFILDCESYEDCLISLAKGFQCSKDQLENSLAGLSNNDIWVNEDEGIQYGPYLLSYVTGVFGPPLPLDGVYWFHATRTLQSNMFDDGLLNLNAASASVWEMIIDNAPSDDVSLNLQTMKDNGGFDTLYSLRTEDSLHWGPYAALVKELVIDVGETSQRDYLKLPELVEDICNGYKLKFGLSLHDHYEEQLVPKIVRFLSSYRLDEGCLEAALAYVHSSIHDDHISDWAITCFDSDGNNISCEDIEYVETVEN